MAQRKVLKKEENVVTPNFEEEVVEKTYKLLAGYKDENGIIHNTYTMREMTGKDEEAISRPDVKGNPCRAASVLLARVCTSIGSLTPRSVGGYDKWEKLIKNLYVGDQDIMFITNRKLSYGSTVSVTHQCPNEQCKRKLETEFDLDELEIIDFKGEREIAFNLPKGYTDKKGNKHNEGILRLPTGLDREVLIPVARTNVAKANTSMLTRLCTFKDGYPIDDDVMAALTVRDREYLNTLLQENLFGVKTEIDVMCPDCGKEFKGSLNVLNFI